MAIVGKLMRLQFGGKLFDTEEWSTGLHMSGVIVGTIEPAQFQAAVTEFFNAPALPWQKNSSLEYIKFNEINSLTGKYVEATSHTFNLNSPPFRGGAAMGVPQVALAVGLTTPRARGRGHAGRMYIPAGIINSSFPADGRLTVAEAGGCAGALVNFINACNSVDLATDVVVFSKADQTVTQVTGARCGRVYDTIRSRRTSLLEEHVRVPL